MTNKPSFSDQNINRQGAEGTLEAEIGHRGAEGTEIGAKDSIRKPTAGFEDDTASARIIGSWNPVSAPSALRASVADLRSDRDDANHPSDGVVALREDTLALTRAMPKRMTMLRAPITRTQSDYARMTMLRTERA